MCHNILSSKLNNVAILIALLFPSLLGEVFGKKWVWGHVGTMQRDLNSSDRRLWEKTGNSGNSGRRQLLLSDVIYAKVSIPERRIISTTWKEAEKFQQWNTTRRVWRKTIKKLKASYKKDTKKLQRHVVKSKKPYNSDCIPLLVSYF